MDRKRKKSTEDYEGQEGGGGGGGGGGGRGQEEEEEPDTEGEDEDDENNSNNNMEGFMCFSSLQTVLAMELCRDTRPSGTAHQDGLYASDASPLIPMAFLKLIMVAAASIYREQEDQQEQQQGRQCWKVPRHGSEWSRINRGACHLDSAARDGLFRRKYSMSYACFLYLVEELRPFIQSDCSFFVRAPLEVERAVALVIFRLAHGFSARQVAEKYNVGASTVGKYTLIVTAALADANKLYSRYVAIPSGDRLRRIISNFQTLTNLPNLCGAMDGTHIKLFFKPARCYYSPSAQPYRGAYKFHSIFLQGVCDSSGVFWHISCAPGGGGGGGDLRRKVLQGVALQDPVVPVGGIGVPVKPYVVAKSEWPIQPFCIKPFGAEDGIRKAFDEQVLKGISCVERGLAVLKARWKILRCMNVHLIHASQLAVACCVLHNICQLWGEPEPQEIQGDGRANGSRAPAAGAPWLRMGDEESRAAGEEIREALFRDWVKRSLEDCSLRPPEPRAVGHARN